MIEFLLNKDLDILWVMFMKLLKDIKDLKSWEEMGMFLLSVRIWLI